MATRTTAILPGMFCWVDLAARDAAQAKDFYTKLMGWKAMDVPGGAMGTYTMLQLDGKEVAALYQMDEERMAGGCPGSWMSYLLVEDVEKMEAEAVRAGATVHKSAFDVMEKGRMAVVQDPTGAIFALWQQKCDKDGGELPHGTPGSMCWNELMTEKLETAENFYTELFGWTTETMPMGPMNYTVYKKGDRPAGGMMTLPEEAKKHGAPPHWLVYFAVEDCDAIVGQAKELGASVKMPCTEFENVGRGAVVADPGGAVFGVIRLKNQ